MKTLKELVNLSDPGLPRIHDCVESAPHAVEILPPGPARSDVLQWLQASTRSALGAVGYETGGIIVDGGWLRILGAGHERCARNLKDWNDGRASGFMLVADDAAGGFFALNGGALAGRPGDICYWAPDTLEWEQLDLGYGAFVEWACSPQLAAFYEGLRWSGWKPDVAALAAGQCFAFYPYLWTKEGSINGSMRKAVPVDEHFAFSEDIARQLAGA